MRTEKLRYWNSFKVTNKEENEIIDILNGIEPTCSYDYRIGFECLGPLMYSFVRWINDRYTINKCDQLVFLAREGGFIKECFENLIDDFYDNIYLEISRKSITIPCLIKEKEVEKIIDRNFIPHRFTLEELGNALGIEPNNIPEELRYISYAKKQIIEDERVKIIVESWLPLIWEKSSNQNELIKKYLDEKLGCNKKTAIVDIGWHGTMQMCLKDFTNSFMSSSNNEYYGFYLGLSNDNYVDINEAEGYLYSANNLSLENKLMSFVGLLEAMFSSEKGSVKEYTGKDKVVPVYEDPDLYGNNWNKIRQIQDGALDFIKHCKGKKKVSFKGLDSKSAIYGLMKLGYSPTINDIRNFTDLKFYNNVKNQSYMIGRPFDAFRKEGLKGLERDFWNSGWKTGYLKNMLRIPFPYGSIYTKARYIREKKNQRIITQKWKDNNY